MRRMSRRLLPVLAMALLVQIFAPVGSCWAASIAASDPLRSAAICSGLNEANPADPVNDLHHQRDGCCSACCIGHVGVPVDPPRAATAAPERKSYRVAWRAYEPDAMAARDSAHAQARAPPAIS